AASSNSLGRLTAYCRKKNTAKGETAKGTMTPQYVSTSRNAIISSNSGSIRISSGIIIRNSTKKRTVFFPLKLYTARAYPTREEKNRDTAVNKRVISKLFLYHVQ